jgi:hypothetical protein
VPQWRVRRRWKDLEWIEKFGYGCYAGFVTVIVTLVIMLVLNGCGLAVEQGPTLPPRTTALRAPQRPAEGRRALDTAHDGVQAP